MPANTKIAKPRAANRPQAVPFKKPQPGLTGSQTADPDRLARRGKVKLAICVLLAVATFAIYSRATKNQFVNYDDESYVTDNPRVKQGLTLETIRWALTAKEVSNWHPLTWMSHALDCQLFGLNPAGHHFTSVLLHVLNAVLLFLLLARATGAPGRSLVVAALFALHPMNVESVAWIAERKNVLCMFFFLLTLAAYGWYARRPGIARYLGMTVLFVLGLAAKPMIVTLPFVLLLVDFWPLHRVQGLRPGPESFPVPQVPLWRLALEKLPLLVFSAASSAITLAAQGGAVANNAGLPFHVRLANALYAYAMYVGKAFWPLHLAAFYPYAGGRLAGWEILLCLLFLIGTTAWVWRERARSYWPVGWFWFLGTLIPMIGLVQVGDQAMADRYAYLPLLGVFVMVVWGAADWMENRKFDPRVAAGASILVLATLSFMTWRQIGTWRSKYDLWSHAIQVTKDNYLAEDYIGTVLLVQAYEATGQRYSDEALVHFQNAARLNPRDAISRLNLGADAHEHGRLPEAIQQYKLVLALTRDPHLVVKALVGLGAGYGQLGEYATARQYFTDALKMDPLNKAALLQMGKTMMEERIKELSTAASAHPSANAYWQLGQLQQGAGHGMEARTSYEAALKLNPKFSAARDGLNSLSEGTH